MYEQLINPDENFPYVGGLCEGFVEGMFGQASKPYKLKNGSWTTSGVWPSATAAWQNNYGLANHADLPPEGVSVPVYFELGSTEYGHVATHLSDGRVLSSSLPGYNEKPFIYKNLQAMIDDYARNNTYCSYLGWSEFVGKARVVKLKEEEPVIQRTEDHYLFANMLSQSILGYDLDREEFQGWVGKTWLEYDEALIWNGGRTIAYNTFKLGQKVQIEDWEGQLAAKDKEIARLNSDLNKIDGKASQKLNEIKRIVS